MSVDWFERYCQVYHEWWQLTHTGLAAEDEELAADFEGYKAPTNLSPLDPGGLVKVLTEFPELPQAVQEFLTQVGVGSFLFPDQHGDNEPTEFRVFSLDEATARVDSIAEHAARELEEIKECGASCFIHGEDSRKCVALLETVRSAPTRFYPLFGPEGEYNFVYVLHGQPKSGRVARWYHDYPVCELLDGSYEQDSDFDNLSIYGDKMIRMAQEGEGYPV